MGEKAAVRKIILYIAMSVDGYIARNDGNVSWLTGHNPSLDNDNSYQNFIKDIDTVIMGWNTYYQVKTELSPDSWVYEDLTTYVFTHNLNNDEEKIKFINGDICCFLDKLKREEGKDIWICGGANLIGQLINNNCIDQYYLTIIPTILGNGIRLFEGINDTIKLKLVKTINYNGITDLIYERR